MPVLIHPEGNILERILETEYSVWPEGLSRPAFDFVKYVITKKRRHRSRCSQPGRRQRL